MTTKSVPIQDVKVGDTIRDRGKVIDLKPSPPSGIVATLEDNAGKFQVLWSWNSPVVLQLS